MTATKKKLNGEINEDLFCQFSMPQMQGESGLAVAVILQTILDAKYVRYHITKNRIKQLIEQFHLDNVILPHWIDREWAKRIEVDPTVSYLQYRKVNTAVDYSKPVRGVNDTGVARVSRMNRKKSMDAHLLAVLTEMHKQKQQNEQQINRG